MQSRSSPWRHRSCNAAIRPREAVRVRPRARPAFGLREFVNMTTVWLRTASAPHAERMTDCVRTGTKPTSIGDSRKHARGALDPGSRSNLSAARRWCASRRPTCRRPTRCSARITGRTTAVHREAKRRRRYSMKATQLLKKDHQTVKRLFADFNRTTKRASARRQHRARDPLDDRRRDLLSRREGL